jgi:hypothetical protein
MDLNKDIEAEIILKNNTPLDDFLGLTPTEIHNIIYDPLDNDSIIRLNDNIDENTLDQIPLFKISEEYLRIIQRDKQIKLTPLGALPKKVMVELYDKRILLDEHIESGLTKLWKEQDCISIMSARYTLELSGLVKKAAGKLILTKKGIELLKKENRHQLFKEFFLGFTDKFSWGFNDGYPEQPIGQFAWLFSIYMLDKYGDQSRKIDFYAEKYLKAFPDFITYFTERYSSIKNQFIRCYGIRAFDRFLLWFGFVSVDRKQTYSDSDFDEYKKTDLLRKVFHVETN